MRYINIYLYIYIYIYIYTYKIWLYHISYLIYIHIYIIYTHIYRDQRKQAVTQMDNVIIDCRGCQILVNTHWVYMYSVTKRVFTKLLLHYKDSAVYSAPLVPPSPAHGFPQESAPWFPKIPTCTSHVLSYLQNLPFRVIRISLHCK